MTAEITRLDTRALWELFQNSPLEFYQRVAQEMNDRNLPDSPTLSRVLEYASPSENGELDAFGRCLREAGILTRSNPQAGIWASPGSEFFERGPANRALYTEFFARHWRRVSFADRAQRAILLDSAGTPGSWQRPYTDGPAYWEQQIAPAIPLAELVAMTTPISGDLYRSLYMEYDAAQLRQFRVGESAELPIATIEAREHTITLQKFGRGLRTSYENLRRMRVDKLAFYIQLAAVQSEVDKLAAALNIIINGDGNTDTAAATHNLTTLDTAASAGTLTIKGWLAFKLKFVNPYALTTGIMQEAVALQLITLNSGSANVPLANLNMGGMVQQLTPINQTSDGVRYGWDSNAPSLKIVGFDRRFAIEQLTEIGANIAEMERFITNQTQVLTMSEVSGFGTLDPTAALILDVNA